MSASLGRIMAGSDRLDLATRLTLILFLVSDWVVSDDWVFSLPLRLLGLAGLVVPSSHRRLGLWVAVLAVIGGKTVAHWWTQDNHHFLLTYWCLALTLALAMPAAESDAVLSRSARWLLGLSFLFASLWKGLLSPDFLDGSYFYYTFLTDNRFVDLAAILGRVPDAIVENNRDALARLYGPAEVLSVSLQAPALLRTTTRLVTWWTLAIESTLALTFLWPGNRGPARLRHWVLLLFAWTTYPTVPNVGVSFGWTLMILGVASTERDAGMTRLLYAMTCGVLMIYHFAPFMAGVRALVPWAS